MRRDVYESQDMTGSKNINSITPHNVNLLKTMNYTDYIKDVNFFFDNSMPINMAVLAFQIMDYIMLRPKNQNMYPLPKNK